MDDSSCQLTGAVFICRYSDHPLLCRQLPVQEPLSFAFIYVLHGAIVIQIKDLAGIHLDPEVEASYVKRPACGRNCRMRGPHVAREFAPAGEIAPLGQRFFNAVGFSIPDESIRAVRAFLSRVRCIEDGFDGMIVEVDCLVIIHQKI